jgi:hypothetical protein
MDGATSIVDFGKNPILRAKIRILGKKSVLGKKINFWEKTGFRLHGGFFSSLFLPELP